MNAITPSPEWANDVALEIKIAFPEIDPERVIFIRDRLAQLPENSVRAGWREYLERGGDELFHAGKLLAICHRQRQQAGSGSGYERNVSDSQQLNREFRQTQAELDRAERILADLGDEDVLDLWRDFLPSLHPTVAKWLSGWSAAAAKRNMHFRLFVAELFGVGTAGGT